MNKRWGRLIVECDRCSERVDGNQEARRYDLEGDSFVLCAECLQAIVVVWLFEHLPLIKRKREKRKGGSHAL